MAGQVWTAEGSTAMVMALIGSPPSGITDLELMLFSNEVSAKRTTVLADLVECVFPGYSRFSLEPSDWVSLPADEFGRGIAWHNGPPLAWTASGTSTDGIWGWGVVNATTGFLWWLERFNERKPMGVVGDFFQMVLQQRLTSEEPPMIPPS